MSEQSDDYVRELIFISKQILDACCGSRMFWFDKENEKTLYMDKRKEKFSIHGKHVNVDPDVIADFRDMPFEDNSFYLVVYDPPHLKLAMQIIQKK